MKTSRSILCLGLLFVFFTGFSSTVKAQLKADFTANTQSGCAPLVVFFQDQSTGSPSGWSWNLGNGTKSTLQNPVTTYFNPGTYMVTLTVTNSSGKDSIAKKDYITVSANPQASFTTPITEGCFPLGINFKSTSNAGSGSITSYLWDFGDGNISTEQQPSHTYTSAGTFDVTLKVTNSAGCINAITKSDLINIDAGVNAAFTLNSLDVCKSPAVAGFKNQSDGTGTLIYNWDFGDGTTSSSTSPNHPYANSGTYNVELTAQSLLGCSDTANMQLTIAIPASSFNTTTATCSNQSINFTNTSVPTPISVTWDFGDGTTSTQLNPGKTYTKPGTYKVKLVNTFSSSCSDSVTKTITVVTGPTASFTADDTSKCAAPLTTNFKNLSKGGTQFTWDFGDGTTSKDFNPTHTYTKTGNFTVKLTATNANGCTDVFEKTNYINIQPIKITGLTNLPDSGCVPLRIQTSGLLNISAKIKKYTWDFGDGTTSTDSSPVHIYTKEGVFSVKLTIETQDGCSDTYIKNSAVLAGHKPVANFISNHDSICINETVQFKNTSTNGPITFLQWDFKEILDSANGEYYYYNGTDTGYHPVTLVAFNYGCTDTTEQDKLVYIKPPIASMSFQKHCDTKQLVNFTDNSIADIIHNWDFGDGKTDTTKNATHTYTTTGSYTVNLYTTNGSCKDTATQTVRIINEIGTLSVLNAVYCRGNNMPVDITGVNVANIKSTTWDFGDGTVITVNGATKSSHTYTKTGRFLVKATMTDLNNCQSQFQSKDSITVYGPLAGFGNDAPGACQDSTITFTDKSQTDGTHNIIKWSWDYGDHINHDYTNSATFNHTYTDTGYYSVRFSVTDSYGCTDSSKKNNLIYISHPYASFLVSDSIVCPKTQLTFQSTSTGKGLEYEWNFGDGVQSPQQNPSYTYHNSGTYNPQLSVTDVNGCKDSVQYKNLIVSVPLAKFNMSDSVSTCPPLEVTFTNNSTNFNTYSWSFGDGSTSTLSDPSHIYTYPGDYPVKLTVNGNGSCEDSIIKHITIKGPTGKFTYDSLPACYPSVTHFSAQSKNSSFYTWDFSDGNTIISNNTDVTHTYDPGVYVPKLILTDASGCKVAIHGDDSIRLYDVTAKAEVINKPSCDSSIVEFTDSSVSADVITNRIWSFGDNTSVDKKQVSHSYDSSGLYSAQLITVTQTGCRDTLPLTVNVEIKPTPKISILSDTLACAFSNIAVAGINNISDTSALTWSWNFGNGTTSSTPLDTISYSAGGNYVVTAKAADAFGCTGIASQKIKINNPPDVYAGPDTTVCQNSTFQLKASGAQTYTWIGEGLSCTNCSTPNFTVNNTSLFILNGADAIGCKNADTVVVNAILPTKITVSNADTVCVGESAQLSAVGATTYKWSPALYLDNADISNPVFKPATDTLMNYKVIGYTQKNCFTDTGFVSVKAFPVPKMSISNDEITLNLGTSVKLVTQSSPDINQWQWQPSEGLDNPHAAQPIASPKESIDYTVIASNGGGCVARDEITVHVVCKNTNVFIPNTFSPNGDGMNDKFFPRGTGLFTIKTLRIFNRWGQLVFERYNVAPNSAMNGWDGTYNGKVLASDVYVYMMEIMCYNNTIIPLKGNVTLLR